MSAPPADAAADVVPETMRAAIYRSVRDVSVEWMPVPRPGLDDVLIEIAYCGICGTDLHNTLEGWGIPNAVGGHEYVGTVAAVGGRVRSVDVGVRVAAIPHRACGECDGCRAGRPSLCRRINLFEPSWQGGFAQYARVHESQVRRIPDELDLRTAALVEPLAVALHSITRADPQADQRMLVTGAGPLGLLVVASLRAGGVGDIVVSEPQPARRVAALAVGATEALAPEHLSAPLLPTRVVDRPFDVAFECSGKASAMEEALAQLTPGGTLVILGTGLTPPRLDPNRIILHELVVTGAFNYDADGFEDALALLASGRLPIAALLDPDDVGLDGLLATMVRLASGELTRKVLVAPALGAVEDGGGPVNPPVGTAASTP